MSNAPPMPQRSPEPFSKASIWPLFTYNQWWQQRLARQAAHKAMDIPPDDGMNIKNGIGWPELLVIGVLLLGSVGLMMLATRHGKRSEPAPIVAPAQSADPADSAYEVRFYDASGNVIPVPHISQLRKEAPSE